MANDLKTYVGHVVNYIYEKSDSLYKVCEIMTRDNERIKISGYFNLEEGLDYEFIGRMGNNSKYGEQFYVESYAPSKDFTEEGLISFLSSDKFPGIGPKIAKQIVEKLGLDCINKMMNDEHSLDDVTSLTDIKKRMLIYEIKKNYETEQVYIKLYGFGLSAKMIERVFEVYNIKAAQVIEENPYILVTTVDGFGFKRCDNLAMNLNISFNDPKRIKAALIYTLNYVSYNNGYTYLTKDQLIKSTITLLSDDRLQYDLFLDSLNELIESDSIIYEDDRIYDKYLYECEISVASDFNKISARKTKLFSREKIEKALDEVEKSLDIEYTYMQKEAIISSIGNKLSIITGGPGTGKSTILKGILFTYALLKKLPVFSTDMEISVKLASPTGRAAKRMNESTGFKAQTIHKLLGYTHDDLFTYNEKNLLPCDLLIIDEVSMLDIMLTKNLLKALSYDTQIILVGDSNQLPSVGPGNLLYDLMNTNIFKTTRLNQIMRQAKDSNIIALSNMVLQEKIDYRIFSSKKEVYFFSASSTNLIDGIFTILDRFIAKGGNLNSSIQILIPIYAGISGIDEVNKKVQERYNHNDKILIRDEKLFKINDKVLQLKNDSDLEIMNGDIGEIIDIVNNPDGDYMRISFDDRVVKYSASNLDNLSLAYAMSVHKSQGSEFDNVIIPILPAYSIMLRKRIIYTAITRAKKNVFILGDSKLLDQSLLKKEYERQTTLSYRIKDNVLKDKSIRIDDKDIPFDTLGEYDMEGITPYSFME